MEEIDFSALEAKVDELVAHCDALIQENQQLRAEQRAWQEERAALVGRNDLAKAKLEAMIERLKNPVDSVDEAS